MGFHTPVGGSRADGDTVHALVLGKMVSLRFQTQLRRFFRLWQAALFTQVLQELRVARASLARVNDSLWRKTKSELIELAGCELGMVSTAAASRTAAELRLELKENRDAMVATTAQALLPKSLSKLNKAQLQGEMQLRGLCPDGMKNAEMLRALRLWAQTAEHLGRTEVTHDELCEYADSDAFKKETYNISSSATATPEKAKVTPETATATEDFMMVEPVPKAAAVSSPKRVAKAKALAPPASGACAASSREGAGSAPSGISQSPPTATLRTPSPLELWLATLDVESRTLHQAMADHVQQLAQQIHDQEWDREAALHHFPATWGTTYGHDRAAKILDVAMNVAPIAGIVPVSYQEVAMVIMQHRWVGKK